jgi:GT2 family glycosyltransferase
MNPDALQTLPGTDFDYTVIDSGVWFSRRSAFDRVNGLDEALSSWGHAQTDFQHRLFKTGTEFVRIPEVLYFHPMHAASRDIIKAHDQLQARGVDLKVIWSRYHGVNPY